MTEPTTEPTTEPGKWLVAEYARTPGDPKWYPGLGLESTVIAIESEAGLLNVERLYDALAHWYDGADGGESFRLVPMSSDGGVMPTGDLHPFAAAIAREYAKDPQS